VWSPQLQLRTQLPFELRTVYPLHTNGVWFPEQFSFSLWSVNYVAAVSMCRLRSDTNGVIFFEDSNVCAQVLLLTLVMFSLHFTTPHIKSAQLLAECQLEDAGACLGDYKTPLKKTAGTATETKKPY